MSDLFYEYLTPEDREGFPDKASAELPNKENIELNIQQLSQNCALYQMKNEKLEKAVEGKEALIKERDEALCKWGHYEAKSAYLERDVNAYYEATRALEIAVENAKYLLSTLLDLGADQAGHKDNLVRVANTVLSLALTVAKSNRPQETDDRYAGKDSIKGQ